MTTNPVMTITDELLAELDALSDKATPGPWWIDSHGHCMVSEAKGDHAPVFSAKDLVNPARRHPETGNLSHWPNDWDATFIARLNPLTTKALLRHIADLKERCAAAEKDAGRYRWLRDPDRMPHDSPMGHLIVGEAEGEDIYWRHILDQAIDAATQSQGETK